MPSIRDVAARAGVSAGTVSNVLNRPSYVNAETRDRVRAVIDELGFVPRNRMRQYRPGRVRTLGLAIADMANPFFVDVALGAEAEGKNRGVGVIMVHNGEDRDREEQNLDLLAQQRVHGIMIAPVDESNRGLETLLQRGVPVVFVDRISGDRPCCWIATDDRRGGELAGRHLIDLGHRRLAFVGDPDASRQVKDRLRGFLDAAGRGGSSPEIIRAMWTLEEGRRVGAELVRRPPGDRPTAVFCANDMIALGILQEAALNGIAVPGELAIAGFDDITWAGRATVPLTTIRQARHELGRAAVRKLLEEIEQGPDHTHEHVSFEPELVVRASTSPL
ncbi:MAG: LacI family transcriptional regulator [Actinomycetota bacterium]|nr:LacI family transcriptional regulator [Actinomycetota bacterium]